MKQADDIKRIYEQAKIDTLSSADKAVLEKMKEVFLQESKAEPEKVEPSVWRIIMKSKITKLAAVAAVLLIVASAVTLLDHITKPAYAIEQTIEAMRSIKSIHAFTTDWDDSQGETWIQINPETGQEEYHCSDQNNLLIVATPQTTHYYYKDKNLVKIRNGYAPASDVRISHFFEDLVKFVQQYHGELSFYSQFDKDLQKEIIVVNGSIPTQGDMKEKEFIVRVDYQTKLPISLKAIKCGPGQGVKSVYRIEYNVTIPEGIFDFEIPTGAKVVNISDVQK